MEIPVFKAGHFAIEVFLEYANQNERIRNLETVSVELGLVYAFDKRLDCFNQIFCTSQVFANLVLAFLRNGGQRDSLECIENLDPVLVKEQLRQLFKA